MNEYYNKLVVELFSLENEVDLENIREGASWRDGCIYFEAVWVGLVWESLEDS